MGSLLAELLVLRKRVATWILLTVAMLLSVFFNYVLPYYVYVSGAGPANGPAATEARPALSTLLPESLVATMLGGFPFYFGMLTLILGALMFGSEYGWGTLKTTLMQRPSRSRFLLAKLGALGVMLVLFTIAPFGVGAISSYLVAVREGAAVNWPPLVDVVRGFGAGWLILGLWTLFGALLATLSRGTALAIGLGIVYGLVIEGLISGFGRSVDLLQDISYGFLRTNAYSLIAPFRVGIDEAGGPGAFAGPFVDGGQALLVIVAYLVIFAGISSLVLQRRDVT